MKQMKQQQYEKVRLGGGAAVCPSDPRDGSGSGGGGGIVGRFPLPYHMAGSSSGSGTVGWGGGCCVSTVGGKGVPLLIQGARGVL